MPGASTTRDLRCGGCNRRLIIDGKLKCLRCKTEVPATLGEKIIFCPNCSHPRIILAKNDKAWCPKKDCRRKTPMRVLEVGMVTPRETVETLIRESKAPPRSAGTHYLSKYFLGTIGFSDFMDIVLYRVSLDPDLDKIACVRSPEFWDLIEKTWREWDPYLKKAWGYRRSQDTHYSTRKWFPRFWDLDSAWQNGPGPMGGTAGAAEMYAFSSGLLHYRFLLEFFRQPVLPEGIAPQHNWPARKQWIESRIFPRFRRKQHQRRLQATLDFAEEICTRLRKRPS